MTRRWVFFALAILLGAPGLTVAEEVQKGESPVYTMDEVVVTATKTEEKRKDVANSVVLKDRTQIDESPAATLGEFLANEPGVDWRTYGDYGGASQQIHIRGIGGEGTQVFVNGVNVNSPSLGTADVGRIPLNSIDRIEVVKGAGSLLYGSGAMGGTVNIFTKSPERGRIDFRTSAGYGSDDTYELSAEQGMFLSGDFGYYLTATHRAADGFRKNAELDHTDVTMKLVLDKGAPLYMSLYGDYIDRDYGRPGVRPPKGTGDFYVAGVKVYDSRSGSLLDNSGDEDTHVVFHLKSRPLSWLDLRLRGDYTSMENENYTRYVNFGGSLVGSRTWTDNRVLGVEGDVTLTPFSGTSILVGTEYKHYDWKNTGVNLDGSGAELPATRTSTDADLHTTGVYGEIQYRPCRYFKGIIGLRHEDHSQFGNEDLPRFGMIFNPWEKTALKLSTGRHFRAPTPNDLYWPAGPWTKGNANLDPETGWHSDVTLEQSLAGDRVFFTCSFFHWDIDDKIQWGPDSTGVWTPQNLRTYKADGLEAGVKVGPFYNTTLSLDYTYLDATEEGKEYYYQSWWPTVDLRYNWRKRRATYTPNHQFKGAVTWWSRFGLTATGVARYVSNRVFYRDEAVVPFGTAYRTVKYTLGGYWTVDFKLSQRIYDRWILSFQADNLLDEEYDTYMGTFTASPPFGKTTLEGFPGAGRFVSFRLTFEY